MAISKKNNFTILTKDSDFYDISLIRGAPPKVIWLQLGNTSKQNIINLLIKGRDNIHEFLIKQNLHCLELY